MNRAIQRSQPIYPANPRIHGVIEELTLTLRQAGVADPLRVATDIIAALLDVSRSWPSMNLDASLETSILSSAREAAHRLASGAPFAYAVGTASFRRLTLVVDERVLIPRPETEVLVDEILQRMEAAHLPQESWGTAVDIGTGSGAIALSLASEGRFDRVIATDASIDALAVARLNRDRAASALGCEVDFRHGSLMAPVIGVKAAALVSNPPYITFSEAEALPASVRNWEPAIALLSGHDGMSATRAIVCDGAAVLASGGALALEVDERRASLVAEMIMGQGCYTDVGVRLDLSGRERFVFATRI